VHSTTATSTRTIPFTSFWHHFYAFITLYCNE